MFSSLLAQKYIEPENMKQFNITVNYDDYTVKTQMLKQAKNIKVNNDLTYMWYASQKIMETKGGFEGKLIHGNYTSFYLNNQLKEQGTIRYGLRNKKWKYWYPDGKLREVINWKNGLKNGEYLLYNDYGQLMAKGNFKNDKLHKNFYTYGPDGKVIEKKKYKSGNEVIEPPKTVKTKKEKEKKIKEAKPEGEKDKSLKREANKEKKKKEKKPKQNKTEEKIITS